MPNAVIQPCADPVARAHFARTMATPVPLERIAPFVPAADLEQLREIYGQRGAPTWGATAGKNDVNVSQWRKLAVGDVVLFMREHHVFTSAVVTHKLRSPELARHLWTLKDGQPFEYVFFLDEVQPRTVHYDVLRQAAPFSASWNPLKFWVISDARAARILSAIEGAPWPDPTSPATAREPRDPRLGSVRTIQDIRAGVASFNADAGGMPRELLTQTHYWVFDPQLDVFAPSKFVGVRDMSLARYAAATQAAAAQGRLAGFDGHKSRKQIERVVGSVFEASAELNDRLIIWAEELSRIGVFDRVDRDKWRFILLPGAVPQRPSSRSPTRISANLDAALEAARAGGSFDAAHAESDERRRVLTDIVRRRGQPRFRRMLIAAYDCRCAVTGCEVVDALEAAHLVPYRNDATNHPTNGLPLRSDIHTLFDLGLLTIDPDTLTVLVHPDLRSTSYGEHHGRMIRLPADPSLQPNRDAVRRRRAEAGF